MGRYDGIYGVNMKRLGAMLLPTWLRGGVVCGLVYAGVGELGRLLGELRELRDELRIRLGMNGQVCCLRGLLNDEFDAELRGIRVEDVEEADDGIRLWLRDQGCWVMAGRGDEGMRIGRRGCGGDGTVGFKVVIPERLRGVVDEGRVKGLVNCVRLGGMRWDLVYG